MMTSRLHGYRPSTILEVKFGHFCVSSVVTHTSCLLFPAFKMPSDSMSTAFNDEHPEVKPYFLNYHTVSGVDELLEDL